MLRLHGAHAATRWEGVSSAHPVHPLPLPWMWCACVAVRTHTPPTRSWHTPLSRSKTSERAARHRRVEPPAQALLTR